MANVLLAAGASPAMVHGLNEVMMMMMMAARWLGPAGATATS